MCFDEIVGLEGVCDDSIEYTYTLDEIGITKDLLENANYSKGNATKLLVDQKKITQQKILRDVHNALRSRYRTRDILSNKKIGYYSEKRKSVSQIADSYAGMRITIPAKHGDVKVDIHSLGLYADTTGDVDIKIFNLRTGEELSSTTIAAESGKPISKQTNITITADANGADLFIGYLSTFDAYETRTKLGCNSCSSGYARINNMVYGSGASITSASDKLVDNIKTKNNTYGVSIGYSISCDFDAYVCRSANKLALAYLYRLGYNICIYALHSTRFNNTTTIDREMVESMAQSFEKSALEEFQGSLDGLVPDSDNICIKCRKKTFTTGWTPS